MCSNDVGRKMQDGSVMSIIKIKIVCIVQLSLTDCSVEEVDGVVMMWEGRCTCKMAV